MPSISTRPSTASNIPRGRCIGKIDNGTAGTGTLAAALPAAPSTANRTCHDSEVINHSDPVKNAGSAPDRTSASELGGCFDASPVSGVGGTAIESTTAPEQRTSIPAPPGMTLGGRIVTNSLYGPASTCSKTSLFPTCACAGATTPSIATMASATLQRKCFIAAHRASTDQSSTQSRWRSPRISYPATIPDTERPQNRAVGKSATGH